MEEDESEFIYVMIPESLMPIDRGDLYEDPLDDALQEAGVGYVSGGGTALGDEQEDGSRFVEYCGVDVEASDLAGALQLLRRKLPELNCPAGTQLHYDRDGKPLQDEYTGSGWNEAQPRPVSPDQDD